MGYIHNIIEPDELHLCWMADEPTPLDHYREPDMSFVEQTVPVIKPSREYGHWAGTESVAWTRESIASFDAVVIATNHSDIDYAQLAEWAPFIVDTRNAMNGKGTTKPGQVWKA